MRRLSSLLARARRQASRPASVCVCVLAACGPRVFDSDTAKLIELPAPPPIVHPSERPRVEVTDDKIVIHEKIQFDYNAATIRPESDDLLAEIAAVMQQHPRITKIRVDGHASAEGNHDRNVELSRRRAEAVVEHLVARGGVDAARLSAEGFGPDQPIADNETEAGREANRRVEFTILEQVYTETTTTTDPVTGERQVETRKVDE